VNVHTKMYIKKAVDVLADAWNKIVVGPGVMASERNTLSRAQFCSLMPHVTQYVLASEHYIFTTFMLVCI